MRRYAELNEAEREAAVEICFREALQALLAIGPEFLPPPLRPAAEAAAAEAEANYTPWFTAEYLIDVPEIREYLRELARADAEKAYYLENNEIAVYLPRED